MENKHKVLFDHGKERVFHVFMAMISCKDSQNAFNLIEHGLRSTWVAFDILWFHK